MIFTPVAGISRKIDVVYYISAGDSKAFDRPALRIPRTVDIRTFLIFGKCFPCRLRVAIDLPAADALTAPRAIFDETADVLRRIAEEQPDLMRELVLLTHALHQPDDAALGGTACRITALAEQTAGRSMPQVTGQTRGPVHIDKRAAFFKSQRQDKKSLSRQKSVPAADTAPHFPVVCKGAGKQARRF